MIQLMNDVTQMFCGKQSEYIIKQIEHIKSTSKTVKREASATGCNMAATV